MISDDIYGNTFHLSVYYIQILQLLLLISSPLSSVVVLLRLWDYWNEKMENGKKLDLWKMDWIMDGIYPKYQEKVNGFYPGRHVKKDIRFLRKILINRERPLNSGWKPLQHELKDIKQNPMIRTRKFKPHLVRVGLGHCILINS